jgi:hypothetical protein
MLSRTALALRNKKQTMIDLRGIPTNSFENQLYPSFRLSRLWTLFTRRNELGACRIVQDSAGQYLTEQLRTYHKNNGQYRRATGTKQKRVGQDS